MDVGKSERDGDAASGLRNGGADEEMSQILDEAAGCRAVFLCGGVDENGLRRIRCGHSRAVLADAGAAEPPDDTACGAGGAVPDDE